MKKYYLILMCWLALFSAGFSQVIDTTKADVKKIEWINSVQMSTLLNGNDIDGAYGQLSTAFQSGIRIGRVSSSVGIGISDYYNYLILPLFLEVQYDVLKSNYTPFVYANAGQGIILLKESSESNADGGLNAGAGIGFRWKLNGVELYVKSGFQMQKVRTVKNQYYYEDIWLRSMAPASPTYELTRTMRRLKFTVGLNF